MAYPAFDATPWVYHVNHKSRDLRVHAYPNSVAFGSDSDADATIIAALFAAALTGTGQQTMLSKRLGQHNLQANHPAGTLYTAKAVMVDSTGAAYTTRVRNFDAVNFSSVDLAALFTGVLPGGYAGPIVALSAPPTIPSSGNAVAVANVTVVNRT